MAYPRVSCLTKEEIESIHEASLWILEHVGIRIFSNEARDILSKAGAKVEGETVYLPPKLVETQIKKAPAEFTLHARNPARSVRIGGDNFVLAPGYGAPFVSDLSRGRREGTMEDFINLVKITQACSNLDLASGVLTEPNDVPEEIRHVKILEASLKYSDKCLMGSPYGKEKAQDTIRMAEMVFGREFLEAHTVLITLINTLPPLSLDGRMAEALMEYARHGQAVIIASMAQAGSTSPVTISGTLAQINAEILAGITLAELVKEGAPVVYGCASHPVDMRNGAMSIGAPETALITISGAQMAKYYGLPCRSGGALTDSKIVDAQAAAESMHTLMATALSGVNFVLHAAGILETYLTMSYEKLIIDDELCGMVRRLRRGFAVDENGLALQAIAEAGPQGFYLDKMHTLHNFRQENWEPRLLNRENYSHWAEKRQDLAAVAFSRWQEILACFEPPGLGKELERDLAMFVERLEKG